MDGWNRVTDTGEIQHFSQYLSSEIATSRWIERDTLNAQVGTRLREYHGYVYLCEDGTYWTDVENKGSSVRMVQIQADNFEEAQAAALMLWRMEG